jgi:D-alanyl-D-alanine carboxypeptidase
MSRSSNHLRNAHQTPDLVTSLPLLARPASGRIFSRRSFLAAAAGIGIAAAAGVKVSARSTGMATTTAPLNLRSRSNTSSGVILVIPQGASVVLNGRIQNGFQDVTYNGTPGWAHGDYLAIGGEGNPGGTPSGTAIVHSALNLRSGPSTSHQVLQVMPGGASVTLLGEAQNGFQKITYKNQTGWAYGDWLLVNGTPIGHGDGPPPGGNPGTMTRTTTAALNLRSGPSLQDKVILVMPQGAKVTDTGTVTNNFSKVTYNGTTGWAHIDYLK